MHALNASDHVEVRNENVHSLVVIILQGSTHRRRSFIQISTIEFSLGSYCCLYNGTTEIDPDSRQLHA